MEHYPAGPELERVANPGVCEWLSFLLDIILGLFVRDGGFSCPRCQKHHSAAVQVYSFMIFSGCIEEVSMSNFTNLIVDFSGMPIQGPPRHLSL